MIPKLSPSLPAPNLAHLVSQQVAQNTPVVSIADQRVESRPTVHQAPVNRRALDCERPGGPPCGSFVPLEAMSSLELGDGETVTGAELVAILRQALPADSGDRGEFLSRLGVVATRDGRFFVRTPAGHAGAAPLHELLRTMPVPVRAEATRGAAPRFGTSEYQANLDELTHSVARAGNAITPLFDGKESFAARQKLIADAQHSVHLQSFIFKNDETSWATARLLAEKAEAGLEVRVIVDAVGCSDTDEAIFEMMSAAGVEVRLYGPMWQLWDLNDRWHEKHLIVDGRVSIEGGLNIGDEYFLGGTGRKVESRGAEPASAWRDVDVMLTGPTVADNQRFFLRNWASLGDAVTAAQEKQLFPAIGLDDDNITVRAVQHRPDDDGDDNTHQLMLQAIRSARHTITIENAYFMPPAEIREALIDAARDGVKIRILTNSYDSSDLATRVDVARYHYDELLRGGGDNVEIYERQGDSTLHSKTMTFDGVYSIIGSVNLNGRSRYCDSESALAITDPATAHDLEVRFEDGLQTAAPVTAVDLDEEPFFWDDLRQWLLSVPLWSWAV